MSTGMIWETSSTGSEDTEKLGAILGNLLEGGEAIELVADLGGGKTTFVRGLARGMDAQEAVSSPTFTLSRVYECGRGLQLHHFDFYRLSEPGIVADQLSESLNNPQAVTAIEWSDIVRGVLPKEHLSISFHPSMNNPDGRNITVRYTEKLQPLVEKLRTMREEVEP